MMTRLQWLVVVIHVAIALGLVVDAGLPIVLAAEPLDPADQWPCCGGLLGATVMMTIVWPTLLAALLVVLGLWLWMRRGRKPLLFMTDAGVLVAYTYVHVGIPAAFGMIDAVGPLLLIGLLIVGSGLVAAMEPPATAPRAIDEPR